MARKKETDSLTPIQNDIECAFKAMNREVRTYIGNPDSTVYATTNEHIYDYRHLFENRKNMLSVIASGDQIFNAMLAGVESIDAFDLSRFPKYFLYLKKAAIQSLTQEEYIKFFYEKHSRDSYCDTYFSYRYLSKIRPRLEGEALLFWDALFKKCDWYRIQNRLCTGLTVPYEIMMKNNEYLRNSDYFKLRAILKDIEINFKTGDIMDLAASYTDEYDLIYLSNIHQYIGPAGLKYISKNLKLSPEGVMILGKFYNSSHTKPSHYCDVDLRRFKGNQYKFTKYEGYITGERR